MRNRFLNLDVKAEVQADPRLFLAWALLYGAYDDERQPLHNPDWVRAQKAQEVQKLAALKDKMSSIDAEYVSKRPASATKIDYTLTVTINKNQAQVIVSALDLYSRIGLGQFEEIISIFDPAAKLDLAARDRMRDGLYYAKSQAGHPSNGSYGIHHPDVNDIFRVSYDVQQVIRHRLAWDREPKGGMQVWFDEPRQISKEPLASVKHNEAR